MPLEKEMEKKIPVCVGKINRVLSSLLICILISENQGLEKSRSILNPRKVSGPANLDFFLVWHLDFFFKFMI